jgi:subtilisin family serine protease
VAAAALVISLAPGQAVSGEKLGPHLTRLDRLHPRAVDMKSASMGGLLKMRAKGDELLVSVLIHAKSDEVWSSLWTLNAENVRQFGPIFAAEVPTKSLRKLARRGEVLSMRAARKLDPTLDVSVTDPSGLDLIRTPLPPWAEAGQGAIVGVVDTGIDYTHDDFQTTNGTNTRILNIWDQNTNEFCDQTDIETFTCAHVDDHGHGTHVSGIGAGNGRAPLTPDPAYQYVGVAPEANLIVVGTTFWDDEILDGVRYIFEKAEQYNMPAVVNLSLGGSDGPHDGTDPFDVGLDVLAGPGQVVVTSAGNEGRPTTPKHQYEEWDTSSLSLPWRHHDPDSSAYYGQIYFTIWHSPGDSFQVRVVSPASNDLSCGVGQNVGGVIESYVPGKYKAYAEIYNPDYNDVEYNGEKQIFVVLGHPSNPDQRYSASGTWTIELTEDPLSSPASNWMHSWVFRTNGSVRATYFENGDNQITVSSPGSSKSVITVGAYVTKSDWIDVDENTWTYGYTVGETAPFSSRGPMRDGRFKPDISAPGSVIASALAAEIAWDDPDDPDYDDRVYVLADQEHWVMQGTSMSSPHIAGLVALLLGSDQSYTYTAAALKSVLGYTANRSGPVGSTPNNTWGYGKAAATDALSLADDDLPRFTSAEQQTVSPADADTLVARGTGFDPLEVGSPERYLYQWQRHNGTIYENILGANYRRLEPQQLTAGDLVRLVVTPYEHATSAPGYDGLLLGRSLTSEQTIASSSAYVYSHTGCTGWCMVSIPTLDDSAITGDFGGTFYSWNETLQAYEAAAAIENGKGYWIEVEPLEGAMHSEGGAVPADDVIIELSYNDSSSFKPGRHLIGNPFNQPIYWENIYVSEDPLDFSLLVTEADTLIHNTYYIDYDNTTEAYHHYDPQDFEERDGKIFPWEGFWVLAKTHVYLLIPADQPAPAASASYGDYPLPVAAAPTSLSESETSEITTELVTSSNQLHKNKKQTKTAESWRLKISASSSELRDDYNYLGLDPIAHNAYDPKDIPDAKTMSGSRHILVYFEHTDWDENPGDYCVDMRKGNGKPKHRWQLTARAYGLDEPVTLHWRRPPPGWQLTLEDTSEDVEVDMNEDASYTYAPFGDEYRSFKIKAKRTD